MARIRHGCPNTSAAVKLANVTFIFTAHSSIGMERTKKKNTSKKQTGLGGGGKTGNRDTNHLVHPLLDNLDILHAHEGTLS